MRSRLRSIIPILLLFAPVAYADEQATSYLRSVVNALGWANEAINVVEAASREKGSGADIEILYANKSARDNYQKARDELTQHRSSKNYMIALSAETLITTF